MAKIEPLEIAFDVKQGNVEAELAKIVSSLSELSKKTKETQQQFSENIGMQKKVLSDMRMELVALEKEMGQVSVSSSDTAVAAGNEISQAVRTLVSEIEQEEFALLRLETTYSSFTSESAKLELQIGNVSNEMTRLKSEGQEQTTSYQELGHRLDLLGASYKELTGTQQALTNSTSNMSGVLSGLTALSALLSAGSNAIGLFNGNSEKLIAVQTRVQSLIAIVNGLQQASNSLQEASAYGVTMLTKAKQFWAAANVRVATTLGISTVAAKALMATLTLGLSVAITGLMYVLDNYITKNRQAAEEAKKFQEAAADAATDVMVSYEKLRKEYDKLGDSLEDKKKFIADNQEAFEGLGVAVNNVAEADNLLINNTDAFRQAMLDRAKAMAATELAAEKAKSILKKELEHDAMPDKVTKVSASSSSFSNKVTFSSVENEDKTELKAEIEKEQKEFDEWVERSVSLRESAAKHLEDANIEAASNIEVGSKKYWEAQQKDAQRRLNLLKSTEKDTVKWKAAITDYNRATEKLKIWDTSKTNQSAKTKDSDRKKAEKELQELQTQLKQDINVLTLAAMDDGREKKLAKLDEEHRQRKQKIKQQREDLIQLEQELQMPSPEAHQKLDDIEKKAEENYNAQKKAVNDAYKKEVEKAFEDLLGKYQTYEDKKTEIVRRYEKERKEIEAKNTDGKLDENLKLLEEAKAKELFALEKSAGGVKSTIAEIFGDLSSKSVAELSKISAKAEGLLAFLQSGKFTQALGATYGIDEDTFNSLSKDPKALQAVEKLVGKINKESKTLGAHLKTLFEKDVEKEEFSQSLSQINQKVQAAIELTGLFASSLRSLAELSGSAALGDVATAFSDVADLAGGMMKGAQAGVALGPVGAAVGAGLGLLSGILAKSAASEKTHREALAKIQASDLAQMRLYNKLLFEQKMLMKDQESIFGVDAITKAVGYLAAYNESLENLNKKTTKKWEWTNVFGFVNDPKTGVQKFATQTKVFQSELDKIQIKTGHKKTGLFGWGKGEDTYSSITDINPDLIDSAGKFNAEMAKSILNSKEFKNGHSEALQEIITYYEQAEEAQKEFDSYLQETFGEMGNAIVDSVVSALKTGEDAFEVFAESVGNVIGKLGKQIMYELFVSEKFKDLQEELQKIYSSGGATQKVIKKKGPFGIERSITVVEKSTEKLGEQVKEAITGFANSMKGDVANMEEFAKAWQESTKDMGFDVWGEEKVTRSGLSQGLAQASQDSVDVLSGRIYAIGRDVGDIRACNLRSLDLAQDALLLRQGMSASLATIAENTSYNRRLGDLADNIADIKERGIKIKT